MSLTPYTPPPPTLELLAHSADGITDETRLRGLEATLQRRDAVLAAVCYAASHFLTTADWEGDVHELLSRLGQAACVHHVYLFEGYRGPTGRLRRRLRNEWAAPGRVACECEPEMRDVEIEAVGLGRWALLQHGQILHGSVSTLPDHERVYFERMAVRTFAAVPVFVGDRWWGYLGLADEVFERDWSNSVLEALQAAAATLGAAIYRMQAEEQLLQSEERFRRLTEAAFEGVLIHDNGVMLEANPAFGRIFGYDVQELVGRNIFELIPTEASRAVLHEHMRASSTDTYEVTGLRRDGSEIIAEITARPTTYRGRPARVATINDVTARKGAEATARQLIEEHAARVAAERAERRAGLLAEASRVLGTSFDYQTTLSTLTRVVVPAMADYCTVDLLARDGTIERVAVSHVNGAKEPLLWELTRWVRPGAPMVHPLRRAILEGESTLVPLLTDEMIASIVIDEAHAALLWQIDPRSVITVPLTATGKVIGCLAMYGSESGRRFDAEDLALAQELASRAALAVENARLFHEAQLATRARDHMLGIVAHDLRNPLGTILMASELLEETLDKELPAHRQVAIMRRAGKQMNRLIQDLLDVKRMENDRLSVEPRRMAVIALLTEAVEMLRPLANASALELTLDAVDPLPDVSVDAVRVQQVLSNLVGNAVKFTPKGGRVTLRAVGMEREVRIAVVDTGPGIPAEQIPHVFGQFWQGARADRRGIGLGLAIAKGIVEAHHGRIWVESITDEGSSFYFTLPIHTA